jgi:hypothetical protein
LTLQQLRPLLLQRFGGANEFRRQVTPLSIISQALGTDDVAVLLCNVDVLVQQLNDRTAYAAGTAQRYLGTMKRVLQVPQVQQLFDGEQLQQVQEQVNTAFSNAAAAAQPASTTGVAGRGKPLQEDAAAAAGLGLVLSRLLQQLLLLLLLLQAALPQGMTAHLQQRQQQKDRQGPRCGQLFWR